MTNIPTMPRRTARASVDVATPRSRIRRPGTKVLEGDTDHGHDDAGREDPPRESGPLHEGPEQDATEDEEETGKDGHDDADEADDDEERGDDAADVAGKGVHPQSTT